MMRCISAALALATFATPLAAQSVLGLSEIEGTYQRPGMSCVAAEPGTPGGPVVFDTSGITIAGITCDFTSRASVSRMDALLVDSSCRIGGKPVATRFFINRGKQGLTVVSRELGTFVFEACM